MSVTMPRLPERPTSSQTSVWRRALQDRQLHEDFVRFLVAGGIAAAVHWLVLWTGLSVLGVSAILATSVGFGVAIALSYFLNYYWTFESESSHVRTASRFVTVAGSGLLLNGAIFASMHYGLRLHYFLAQAVATGIVLFWNFLLYRFWSFHGPRRRRRSLALGRPDAR